MIQILQREPTAWEKFGENISQGLGDYMQHKVQSLREQKMMQEQKQQAEQQIEKENLAFKNMGIDLSGISDPKTRQGIITAALQGTNQQQLEMLKQQGKKEQKEETHKRYANLLQQFQEESLRTENEPAFGQQDEENVPWYMKEFGEKEKNKPRGRRPADMPDSLIHEISIDDPKLAEDIRAAKNADLKLIAEEKKSGEKRQLENRKETLPLRKEFADRAKYAKEAIQNKKAALNLISRGKIDDPLIVHLAEKYLPGALAGKILSSDTAVYKAGLFDEFGVLRQMFPGATRVKEIELLEDKLATLEKSHEAKEKILQTGINKAERDIILADEARKVEKENPNLGLLEFENEVLQRAEPRLNILYDKLKKDYEDIYFKYAAEKNSFVDQNGKVYRDVPKQRLKELFDAAEQAGLELRAK